MLQREWLTEYFMAPGIRLCLQMVCQVVREGRGGEVRKVWAGGGKGEREREVDGKVEEKRERGENGEKWMCK